MNSSNSPVLNPSSVFSRDRVNTVVLNNLSSKLSKVKYSKEYSDARIIANIDIGTIKDGEIRRPLNFTTAEAISITNAGSNSESVRYILTNMLDTTDLLERLVDQFIVIGLKEDHFVRIDRVMMGLFSLSVEDSQVVSLEEYLMKTSDEPLGEFCNYNKSILNDIDWYILRANTMSSKLK